MEKVLRKRAWRDLKENISGIRAPNDKTKRDSY